MYDISSTERHQTEQQERMVRKGVSPDFLNPIHEWRRFFAEMWGTFLLVFIAASGGSVTLGMIVVAPG
jgi:aquaporin Z